MASTYTTNLGIEKIADGEQTETWGDTTNTNFDLIDQGINGIISITLASAGTSGSPNNLPITDGTVSDGRNKFIEFVDGGDLGATAYVQLTPNDAEKLVFIRNSLSGGQSLIVFQGTYNASNDFEIANGKDVVLKFDGAGTGATVTQVFNSLSITELDVNGTVTADGLTVDTDTLHVDATNNRVGIGTSSPSHELDIEANHPTARILEPRTGAAVGTSSLKIHGNRTGASGAVTSLEFINTEGAASVAETSVNSIQTFYESSGNQNFRFNAGGSEVMRIDSSGNVGIGTDSPSANLHISDTGEASILIEADSDNDASEEGGFLEIRTDGGAVRHRVEALAGTSNDLAIIAGATGTTTAGIDSDIVFQTKASGASAAEVMRIDSSGNVGIGTNSPSSKVHVYGAGQTTANITDAGNQGAFLRVSDSGFAAGNGGGVIFASQQSDDTGAVGMAAIKGILTSGADNTTGDLAFSTRNATTDTNLTERMRIDSSGNVGIGTSSPSAPLDVNGNVNVTGTIDASSHITTTGRVIAGENSGSVALTVNDGYGNANLTFNHVAGTPDSNGNAARIEVNTDSTSNAYIDFELKSNVTSGGAVSLTQCMRIEEDGDVHANGDVIAYSTTISDVRLKSDLEPITDALSKVNQLSGYTFTRNHNGQKSAGVIAQELEKVLPEAIKEKELPLQQDDGEMYKVVEYDAIHGLLIQAVKELCEKVDYLERKISSKES